MTDSLNPLRVLIVSMGLLLPTLILIPLGSLWLWQHGYLLYWAIAALLCTAAAFLFERLTLPRAVPLPEAVTPEATVISKSGEVILPPPDPLRTAAEAAVDKLANQTSSAAIESWNDVLNHGLETVEAVAKVYHPDSKDPMLRFTVPEALTLIENVSGKLKPVFEETIPLGSRLTVAQFAQVYRWRHVYDTAGRAWGVWRVARMLNPATAATHEMRERLSKSLMQWAKDSIAGRFAKAYVREVGNAAIDLYSGELRRSKAASE